MRLLLIGIVSVAAFSLGGCFLTGPAGPPGPVGPQGPMGPAGASGASKISWMHKGYAELYCPDRTRPVGLSCDQHGAVGRFEERDGKWWGVCTGNNADNGGILSCAEIP